MLMPLMLNWSKRLKIKWPKFLKISIGVLLAVMLYREWKQGYFKGVRNFSKKLPLRTCGGLLAAFFLLSVLLLPFDPPLLQAIKSFAERYPPIQPLGQYLNHNLNFWAALIGLYFLAVLAGKKEASTHVFSAVLASAFAGALVHLLKIVFLRARPITGLGALSFFHGAGLWNNAREFQSFPSGDVALISGAASYFFYAAQHPRSRPFRWLLFLLPVLSAIARIYIDRHWPSDTLASFGIGLVMARVIRDYRRSLSRTSA